MAISKKIIILNLQDLIKVINEYFSKLKINVENEEFILNLMDDINPQKKYSLSSLEKIIKEKIHFSDFSKKVHSNLIVQYWLNRGYDKKESLNRIKAYFDNNRKFFVSNEEVEKYFLEENPFDFNLSNREFLKNFLKNIDWSKEYVTDTDLYTYFKKYQSEIFHESDRCYQKNKGFIQTTPSYYISRGFSKQESEKIISQRQKKVSKRCKEYYIDSGLTIEEISEKISVYQRQNAQKSKLTTCYWKNLGYSEEEARKKSNEFSKKCSVRCIEHWIGLGFSKEEAKAKVLEYMCSSPSFSKYQNNIEKYIDYCNKHSIKAQDVWKDEQHRENYLSKIKMGEIVSISKMETACFEFLKQYVDVRIKHKPYVVVFPENFRSNNKNKYFYATDGYIEIDGNIIIFEFDSGIFHQNRFVDEVRDEEILLLDPYVLGIIRISDSYFNKKTILDNKEKIVKEIKNGIEKIKNCQEEIIRFETCN